MMHGCKQRCDGSLSARSASRLRTHALSIRIHLKTVSSIRKLPTFKVYCWSLNLRYLCNERLAIIKRINPTLSTRPLAMAYFKPVIKSCGFVGRSWHVCCLSGLRHFLHSFLKVEMQNKACPLRPNSEALGHSAWIKRICHWGLEQQSALNRSESICCDDGWRALKSSGKILLAVCYRVSVQQQLNIKPIFFCDLHPLNKLKWNLSKFYFTFLNVFHVCF